MTAFWWNPSPFGESDDPRGPRMLAARPVGRFDPSAPDPSPGRRLRVFATLVCSAGGGVALVGATGARQPFLHLTRPITYGTLLQAVETADRFASVRRELSRLPYRVGDASQVFNTVPEKYEPTRRDPDLHPALQDLGDEINEDIREALEAFDNPNVYYPGVDEGIEPVTDEHVALVIWALQRELNRELRTGGGFYGSTSVLPAAPLAQLPFPVQRALAERRRFRYRQWGLGRQQWESGVWSLWDVPEDPEYVPRRVQRLHS